MINFIIKIELTIMNGHTKLYDSDLQTKWKTKHIEYYNLQLNNFETDNLIVNGIEMESWDGLYPHQERNYTWKKLIINIKEYYDNKDINSNILNFLIYNFYDNNDYNLFLLSSLSKHIAHKKSSISFIFTNSKLLFSIVMKFVLYFTYNTKFKSIKNNIV